MTSEPPTLEPSTFGTGRALASARDRLRGSKRALLGAGLAAVLVVAVAGAATAGLTAGLGDSLVADILIGLVPGVVAAPLWAGVVGMALERMRGGEINAGLVRRGLERWRDYMTLGAALISVPVVIDAVRTELGGTFTTLAVLEVAWSLGTIFCTMSMVDKGHGVGDALRHGVAISLANPLQVLLLVLALGALVLLGALALGIGLLWAFPLAVLAQAAAYLQATEG